MSKNILRKIGVKKDILNEKDLTRPIETSDLAFDDKFPHPSLINANTDEIESVFTNAAWIKVQSMSKPNLNSFKLNFKLFLIANIN